MVDCASPLPPRPEERVLTLQQYWVVFSFFTVMESFVNIVYWFPFYFVFKFIFLLWLSLPMFRYVSQGPAVAQSWLVLTRLSGADIIFNSFMVPTLGRYFQSGSTSSGLRSKTGAADKTE